MTDVSGRDDRITTFAYGEGTSAFESCSIIWNNRAFVYGGSYQINDYQIARLDGCSLSRIGQLDFSFASGGCAVTQGAISSEIILCFPSSGTSKCRSGQDPTGPFTILPNSNTSHRYTKIAASESEVILADFV